MAEGSKVFSKKTQDGSCRRKEIWYNKLEMISESDSVISIIKKGGPALTPDYQKGLTTEQVKQLQEKYGANKLKEKKKKTRTIRRKSAAIPVPWDTR